MRTAEAGAGWSNSQADSDRSAQARCGLVGDPAGRGRGRTGRRRRLSRARSRPRGPPEGAFGASLRERSARRLRTLETSKRKLARGVQGLAIRIAKALNSLWHGRKGQVFAERYFAVALRTFRHMWKATIYVLNNGRKHGTWTKTDEPDPYSSGPWFRGWFVARRPTRGSPVVPAQLSALPFPLNVTDTPGPRWHLVAGDPLV